MGWRAGERLQSGGGGRTRPSELSMTQEIAPERGGGGEPPKNNKQKQDCSRKKALHVLMRQDLQVEKSKLQKGSVLSLKREENTRPCVCLFVSSGVTLEGSAESSAFGCLRGEGVGLRAEARGRGWGG